MWVKRTIVKSQQNTTRWFSWLTTTFCAPQQFVRPQNLMTKFLWWIVENIFFFKFCSGQVDQVLYDTLQYIPQNTHRFWLTLFRCIYIYSSCWNHEIDFHIFLKHDCFTGIGIILWNNHEEHGINRPMYSWHHSGYGLIQWEEALLSNAYSHWLSPNPEWSLVQPQQNKTKQRPRVCVYFFGSVVFTHLPLVPHICVSELGQHCFR